MIASKLPDIQQKGKPSHAALSCSSLLYSRCHAAFVSKPQDRVAGIRAVVKKMGGKLESCDYCLGDDDLVAIATFPDDTSAAAMSLAVNAPGHLKSYKTTRLMSAKEFLEAQKKAHGVSYKAPNKGLG